MTNRIRNASAALLVLGCLVALTSAFNLPNRSPDLSPRLAALSTTAKPAQQRAMLTLADRVAYQRAIEEVYWRHRIWPKERPDPKPSLDQVMPAAQLEEKVEDYLRNSQALEDYWKAPLSAEQLQAEMERMAQHTKQPEVLRDLFAALGNDPFVIAECLARPALSERLVTNFYAHDQRFHGELRQRAEADLRVHRSASQMKQTGGKYSEIELVRSDSAQDEENRAAEAGLKMNSREWDETMQKLERQFDNSALLGRDRGARRTNSDAPVKDAWVRIKTGVLSPLQEDEGRYYATAIVKKTKDRLKLATVEWRKEPLESWRTRAENQMPKVMAAASAYYTLPTISDGTTGCTDDTWIATAGPPDGREYHTAVWTGSEMIVWGGSTYYPFGIFNTGGRYNPGTDNWVGTSTTNAPTARAYHTAVWSGSEMIVWGGYFFDGSDHYLNTGGRYNPGMDSWTFISIVNAPVGRSIHRAVWTGSEIIIWGGLNNTDYFNTGGRYNPGTDSWTATSTINAPGGRYRHTAVWTGSEMIVWGGILFSNTFTNTGGRYCAQSQAPMAQSAFSRKTHGAAGTFDVPLPLTGNVGVECRSGGATNDYQMIINFATTVTVGSASVTSGTASVTSFSVSGSQVTVNLTGVTNVQRITVTLFNVNDGTHMGNVPVSMGVLVGDVNGNAVVNASDVSLTKSQVGQAVSGSNFREDVNANGLINSGDVALVKSKVGTALP